MQHLRHAWPALVVVAVDPAAASAGMPSVRLTDAATLRFETLSFFLLLFAVSSLVVWRVWNALRTDFPEANPALAHRSRLTLTEALVLRRSLTETA